MGSVYGGRWEVVSEKPLGQGGQAQTWLVQDLNGNPDDRFALKRLKNVGDDARVQRFEREIATIKSLNHPNVLKLVDFDLHSDGKRTKPYLVSEYCSGGSFEDDPTRWAADPVASLEAFAKVCDGVAAAHSRGGDTGPVVHRDIKPANILLRTPDGPPVVGDFGIAYVVDGQRERLTAVDEAVGARLFIAPELADGRADAVRPSSDVYSLGKLLYWMLRGDGRVFDREQHRDERWDLLKLHDRNEYEHVNRVLDNMITHDARSRYRTAEEAADAARYVADLFRRGARAIGPGLRQRCDFCKQGYYEDVVRNPQGVKDFFGSPPVNGSEWRILVCDQCGHVQQFRIERAKSRTTWWVPR